MWLATLFVPDSSVSLKIRLLMAFLWCVFGAIVALVGVAQFRRASTTLQPIPEQATALVTDGIYRHTRNPMYLGMACVLVGFACFLGSIWQLFGVLAFVVYLTRFQIIPEERVLSKKFPEVYADYKQKVRRWI